MGDDPQISKDKLRNLQVKTSVSRKTIVKKYKTTSKSLRRRNRRKRSKKAYFKSLRKNRSQRLTEDLCTGLEEFTVVDMEMAPMCDLNKLPEEITEWQKQDQIAYWKSRAITLEIENRMLHQHIRNFYTQQIDYYEKNKDWKEISSNPNETVNLNRKTQGDEKISRPSKSDKESDCKTSINKAKPSTSKDSNISEKIEDKKKVLPKTPEGKNRLEEMKKIYGNMAPKIMGMETAIQLNYERLVEEKSPKYWPNIPLKL